MGRRYLGTGPSSDDHLTDKEYVDGKAPLVLGVSDPLPANTPDGTVVVRPAADNTIATTTYVDSAITDLQSQSASIEDLFASATIAPAGTITALFSAPVFVAPFPLRVTSCAVTRWAGSDIARNDTNWWLSRLRRTSGATTTQVNIATKTTRLTEGTEPIGEAWSTIIPWQYDSSLLTSNTVAAGEVVNMVFAPQGSAAALGGPIVVTVGYTPL